jgi:uncharacterized protein
MKITAAAVDTIVVVAGLLTRQSESPTARILDGMRVAAFPFLLSASLLAEYRRVLLRPRIQDLHGLTEPEIDELLTSIAANAITREPPARAGAPDTGDAHIWALVQALEGTVLVTGDLALHRDPPPRVPALLPRDFVRSLARRDRPTTGSR